MHRNTVHGKYGQQLRLGKKKKKKENAERKNVNAQTCNPNTVLICFVCPPFSFGDSKLFLFLVIQMMILF